MTAVTWFVRLGLAGVFLVAGLAKLRDRAGAEATVVAMGIPSVVRSPVAFAVCVAELGVAGLLLVPGLGDIGAFGALLLLSAFLVGLGVQYMRGIEVPCACFGQLAATPAGLPTLIRNVVLAGGALFLLISLR